MQTGQYVRNKRVKFTGSSHMLPEKELKLRDELIKVRRAHRDLDDQIVEAEASGTVDQLQIRRFKKQKLMLKDRIQTIEDQLTPDIIA